MGIGDNFKQIRKAHNLTQEQLSKESKISQSSISLWENEERTPNIKDCIKLADYYQISLDELVGRDFF